MFLNLVLYKAFITKVNLSNFLTLLILLHNLHIENLPIERCVQLNIKI